MIACGRPISLQRYAQAHDRGDGRRESQENRKRLRIKISRATWFPMPSGCRASLWVVIRRKPRGCRIAQWTFRRAIRRNSGACPPDPASNSRHQGPKQTTRTWRPAQPPAVPRVRGRTSIGTIRAQPWLHGHTASAGRRFPGSYTGPPPGNKKSASSIPRWLLVAGASPVFPHKLDQILDIASEIITKLTDQAGIDPLELVTAVTVEVPPWQI